MAVCCNGDPNEHLLFHMCPEDVINKIWQEGEGHDTRLSQWAEVGKGAYFSEHLMYVLALSSLYFCNIRACMATRTSTSCGRRPLVGAPGLSPR
jgi:hypothetical protein